MQDLKYISDEECYFSFHFIKQTTCQINMMHVARFESL